MRAAADIALWEATGADADAALAQAEWELANAQLEVAKAVVEAMPYSRDKQDAAAALETQVMEADWRAHRAVTKRKLGEIAPLISWR